jgi:hypothetical protein
VKPTINLIVECWARVNRPVRSFSQKFLFLSLNGALLNSSFYSLGMPTLATSFLGLPLGLLDSSAADGAPVLLGAIKLLR